MGQHRPDRRTFLKMTTAMGVAGLVYPRGLFAAPTAANSRVVIVDDPASISGLTVNAAVVQTMVNAGIRSLTQNNDLNQAWKLLLPGVSSTSKIALKVNCINSSLSTHPAVALAVANSLKQLNFGGIPFPDNNIIIFDRTTWELQAAGYTLNTSASGVRCFATNSAGVGYSAQSYNVAGQSQTLSTIITNTADFLVNIAVLKNHGDAGVTLCLKNHYGSCINPGNLHGDYCNPFVPALNGLAPILNRQKVFIIDALAGITSGGPSGPPRIFPKKLIFSADIVAGDYQGRKLLADNGCTTTATATHIDTAATTYSLGTNNPAQMDVIALSSPTSVRSDRVEIPAAFTLEQNYPNPFNPVTTIQFSIVDPQFTILKVFDVLGREVARLAHGLYPAGRHTFRFDASGMPGGTYFCRLTAGDFHQTIQMVLAR